MPDRPVIIIPDTAPLIHLASGEALGLLQELGRVVVPNVVALEATRLPDKPWAHEIAAWLEAEPVEIVETEIGLLYRIAAEQGLRPPRHAGELSIIEWLRDNLGNQGAALVVYEDKRVPKMISQEELGGQVSALTTYSVLELAEERSIIQSADHLWNAIQRGSPTAAKPRLV